MQPLRSILIVQTAIALGLLSLRAASAQPIDRALFLSDTAYVDFGDPGDAFDLVPGGDRTFALWLRYLQPQYHAKILDKMSSRSMAGFATFVHQYSGTHGVWFDDGDRARRISLQGTAGLHRIAEGAWHHVALVQNDTIVTGYVDGRRDWTYNISDFVAHLASDKGLWLGWNQGDIIHFTGEVDEMSVWRRALTAGELRNLMYSSGPPDTTGLTAYWSFDEDRTDLAIDAGGHGYHGQIHGPVRRLAATRPTGPPFTETVWFYALCAAAGLAMLYGLMRLYALRIDRRRRHLETVVSDRTDEVERQKDQLARQADELKKLDRSKSRFFANISHEFRTPLTLSQAPLEDVLAGRTGETTEATRDRVMMAVLANRRLLRLVNRLLDLAKLEADTLKLEVRETDLAGHARGIALAFEALAERRSITFTHDIPDEAVPVYIDPNRFEEVIGNVLSNAFKFTPSEGRVHLEVRPGDEPVVVVQDNGPGIAPDMVASVFDRFVRADETATKPGSGIGLSLAKEIAERHGARIELESRQGFGATFRIHLRRGSAHFEDRSDVIFAAADRVITPTEASGRPTNGASGQATAKGGPHPDDPSGRSIRESASESGETTDDRTTVLIVDDNDEIRAYVREQLQDAFRVITAENGEEALECVRDAVPDLVISDVMMPRMDGLEFLRELRSSPETDFVPVILLTARAGVEARVEGLNVGADEYLEKPFSVNELHARVRNLLDQRQRLRRRFSEEARSRPLPARDMASCDDGLLEQLERVVQTRLEDEDFDVDALATALALGRTRLYQRVVELTGQPPAAYLKASRLERSAALLAAKAGNVSEVAYATGFRSVSHFSRSFSEHFGMTPSAYAGGKHNGDSELS